MDEIITVWRYEHKESGLGPYNYGPISFSICMAHSKGEHPGLRPTEGACIGMLTLASLVKWFNEWHDLLYAHGFVIRRYNARIGQVCIKQHLQVSFYKVSVQGTYDIEIIKEMTT